MTRRDITAELEAAEAEATGEERVLVIRGEEFILPPQFSKRAILALAKFAKESSSRDQAVQVGANVALDDCMRAVFGDEGMERLDALDLSIDQFRIVVEAVTDMYTPGTPLGESSGSPGSSMSSGALPKPTSNGSTVSTSGEPTLETIQP